MHTGVRNDDEADIKLNNGGDLMAIDSTPASDMESMPSSGRPGLASDIVLGIPYQ